MMSVFPPNLPGLMININPLWMGHNLSCYQNPVTDLSNINYEYSFNSDINYSYEIYCINIRPCIKFSRIHRM